MRNLENAVFKTFNVSGHAVKVRTFLDEDIAQILVDGMIVAEYKVGGAGCTFINKVDPSILIGIIAEIAHSGIEQQSF